MPKTNLKYFLQVMTILLSGCATIVGSSTQMIPITSSPTDASISITDERGMEVFRGQTPTNVTLAKSDGSYWGKKYYHLKITKEGFQPQEITLTASANGWYIAGNILLGGLIGWFIVDPLNGGMYTLSPETISASITEPLAPKVTSIDGTISVVLINDVPLALRQKMRKIN